MKYFCLLWGVLLPALLYAQVTDVRTEADEMPYFKGCDSNYSPAEKRACSDTKLIAFIAKALEYPEQAKANETEGTVYLSFVVDTLGEVIEEKILFDLGDGCGAEALRVAHLLPNFEPAQHAGRKVAVEMRLPIRFNLQNAENNLADNYTLSWGNLKGSEVSRAQLLNNIDTPIFVRNRYGEKVTLDELMFTYERKNKIREAQSRGTITPDLQKIIRKARKKGTFTIVAVVQVHGEFILLQRVFQLNP